MFKEFEVGFMFFVYNMLCSVLTILGVGGVTSAQHVLIDVNYRVPHDKGGGARHCGR